MKKAGEWFEAGVHDGPPNVRGQDAITVVERGIDGISGPLVGPACKAEGVWEHVADLLPVEPSTRPFQTHERGADFIWRDALSCKCGASQPAESDGAAFQGTPLFSVTAFREIAEQLFLIVQLAGDDPAA